MHREVNLPEKIITWILIVVFFIQNLAQIAKSIFGEDPPIKKSGHFVELCEVTASACGLSTRGIDSAIVTILSELREAGIIQSPMDRKID